MTKSKETKYYLSTKSIVILFFLAIILLVLLGFLCLLLLKLSRKTINTDEPFPLFITLVISFLVLSIFLLYIVSSIFRYTRLYFKKVPALILTKDNLVDNIHTQVYNWAEIDKISIVTIRAKGSVDAISISLKDPEGFIKKIKNPFKRFSAKLNTKRYGGTFIIQPNGIKNNSKLFTDLTNYLNIKSDITLGDY
ncbi:MAG: STM3941 family protein [Leadbetterella sp.]